ncbi:creatine kinase, testis isozyme-like [Oculina patagonica]
MAFLLQNLKDFADNRYALLGAGTALGASTLLALGYCYRKHRRKKRDMSSFPNLRNNRTIMGRHLTPDMFSKLKDRCTSNGYDFEKLIESGVRETTSYDKLSASFGLTENSAGLLAGDEECYDLFSELIDPVIGEIHQIDHMESLRSEVNLDWRQIKGGKFYGANVLSCRLSSRRNIQEYCMIPGCTEAALLRVGHVIGKTLECIEEAFGRCFFSLPWQYKKPVLEEYGLHPDSFPPQLSRDWPKGRLIWFTEDRECRVFINFLDHIQLVITQPGGDLQNVFRKYSELLSSIEGNLNRKGKKFMWSSKFGFLASSPHNVGTGLEVQVKVRLETLCKDSRFERIMDLLPVNLEHGDDPQNNVLSISNKHKLQLSEVDIIQQVINSVTLLLELDKRIQRGESILDLLP